MADRTHGKIHFALGGITRAKAGRGGERDRNGSYGQRK
jgi:hypothetical protein